MINADASFLHDELPGWKLKTEIHVIAVVRKRVHVAVYAVFAFLVWRALAGARRPWTNWSSHRALLVLAVCGRAAVLAEFHQTFVPGRTEIISADGIDFIGGLLVIA